ncbi:hypothetical protein [Sphingobacterium hotanense]|uniref:hypothetical protein n=1 Tax=Sphingobacterium hotanense TaxID=649196 RepID=UPI0021A74376|nr:hypothetical protein [Sphingobacterium hotanense]MCT1524148.1 hypothetical protein [Sphingobacterium hotanense]
MTNNAIANASDRVIKNALSIVNSTYFLHGELINPNNSYINADLNLIETNPNNINHPELREYIGTSSISHSLASWNYLSRGIEAILHGDISSCIHLIYYAEIRAVMSIMATEGIGVFNQKHIYYSSAGHPTTFEGGTHVIVDKLIKDWINAPTKKDKVFSVIKLANFDLGNWIQATGSSVSGGYARAVVKDWFSNWSIDLRLKDDQRLRNKMSYRPHFKHPVLDQSSVIERLAKIWDSLEPIESSRFQNLDMHLSRLGIERLFKLTVGRPITNPKYRTYIEDTFDQIGLSQNDPTFRFLMREDIVEDHIIIKEAAKDRHNRLVNLNDPFPMICRAILLSRFASGFTNQLLIDSGVSPNNLGFWWKDIASKTGILDSNVTDIEPIDLFADIRDSLTNLEPDIPNFTTVWDSNNFAYPDLNNLKQFQRACFWGLGL